MLLYNIDSGHLPTNEIIKTEWRPLIAGPELQRVFYLSRHMA